MKSSSNLVCVSDRDRPSGRLREDGRKPCGNTWQRRLNRSLCILQHPRALLGGAVFFALPFVCLGGNAAFQRNARSRKRSRFLETRSAPGTRSSALAWDVSSGLAVVAPPLRRSNSARFVEIEASRRVRRGSCPGSPHAVPLRDDARCRLPDLRGGSAIETLKTLGGPALRSATRIALCGAFIAAGFEGAHDVAINHPPFRSCEGGRPSCRPRDGSPGSGELGLSPLRTVASGGVLVPERRFFLLAERPSA